MCSSNGIETLVECVLRVYVVPEGGGSGGVMVEPTEGVGVTEMVDVPGV